MRVLAIIAGTIYLVGFAWMFISTMGLMRHFPWGPRIRRSLACALAWPLMVLAGLLPD